MHAYFFDIVTTGHVRHDLHGRKLAAPAEALHLAEMIALDIECSQDEWVDTQIEVRDIKGDRLYSVNVRRPDQIVN